ncbi:HAD-IIIC family phosphatase [Rickettsiella endosymbiont of Rhagonycha lignosa]|uniref:HAD-IIIC family phosphatase n=1 Tax=Rickettsiella endosymbiont of Rhagonycha lignosa TaxID=3077937 RepID=UPI00313BA48C
MLILSTFNSEYLQTPALDYPHTPLLKSLFEKFTTESIHIKYVNKNLIGELLNLNLKESKSYAILFRLFDFLEENSIIDEDKLIKHLNLIVKQITVLKQKSSLPFLVFLCPSPKKFIDEKSKKIEKLFIEQLDKNGIHCSTLADVQDGENPIEDDTHIPFNPKMYIKIACELARKLHAIIQKNCKVLTVDCDNTLWTGVVADDGIEGIVLKEHNILLQKYLVEQHKKGKIICLCSKNEEQTVLDAFEHHENEMPLKLKHLSNYNKINWELKSENIKKLALELNVFPDSFRFIDDNPIEIQDVSQIPGVFCITMPQNSEEFRNHWAFDIDEYLIVTETDKIRTEFYEQAEIKAALATKFNDPVEYLRSPELGQSITISKIDSKEDIKTIQRVSQLSGKTNRFNLFPEPEKIQVSKIIKIVKDGGGVYIGTIKDNLSSEDITAVAITSIVVIGIPVTSRKKKHLIIHSLFVSCRVFNRGMEYEMVKKIVQDAEKLGVETVEFKFKKSEKNIPVCGFLNTLSEETNKDPISWFLLNKSKNYPVIHDSLKFFFKKLNLCMDFNSLALNEETVLILPVRKLIDLNLDSLIRTSLNISQQTAKQHLNKLPAVTNEIDEKYLIELKEMTSSLKYLLNKFFLDKNIIDSIAELEIRVNILCNRLLGGEGQDKSLIARGLDSLKATELRFCLYESEKIIITIPMLICEKTTSLTLIDYIKEQKRSKKNDYTRAQSKETVFLDENFYNQIFPVSFQQQRIWLAEQQESAENSANFHMTACYKISLEKLDIQRFKLACQELVNLYDIFGASFFMQNNKLMQLIKSPGARELSFKIRNLNTKESLEEAIQRELDKPWKMSNSSLIRFIVFKDELENNGYIFFHIHHAIFDAISFNNCFDTLSDIYTHLKLSSSYSLKNNPPQYIDYIRYQQKKSEDKVFQTEADKVWREILGKVDGVTKFPNDISQAESKPSTEQAIKRYEFSLSSEDVLALKNLAQLNHVTCFTVLYAVFALVVASYTFQNKITLISATNGRDGHPSFDKMIGFFVNLLVQPFELEANQPFGEYLKQVNEQFLVSQEFQNFPASKILEILGQMGVQGIFSSIAFIYQSYKNPELKVDGEKTEFVFPVNPILFDAREKVKRVSPLFDLAIFAKEIEKQINFFIEYDPAKYSDDLMEVLGKNYIYTLTNVSKNPNQRLGDISVVCDAVQHELIRLGQGPKLDFSGEISLVNKFQQIVLKYPENIALSCGNKRLTYKEVDQQAINLAHALIEAGVKQGNHVGIFLDANYLFFIAELAVLKINAVFIPLSKENPNERLKLIVSDANIEFVIIDNDTKGLFDTTAQTRQLISIDAIKNFVNLEKKLPTFVKNSDTFCILYTSGSTGAPKGVVLQEKGIFRVVEKPNFLKVVPGDKIAQTANQTFDAAQLECWLAWNHGASLVLFNKETILNIDLFQDKLKAEKNTHIWLTAGLFDFLANNRPEIFENLKFLMVGGDVVHKETTIKVLNLKNPPIIVIVYGPTENGIVTSTYIVDKKTISNYETVPIGLPINETQVEIRTPFGSKTPLGGIGELFVAGNGVAKGYLNLQKLTEKRFTGGPGNRYYQTGDLVRYHTLLEGPQLMFIGRTDNQQVKINGNLVALEEVRNCLSRHQDIQQVEVLVTKIGNVNKLVAFYTSNSMNKKNIELANKMFHSLLSESLPAYMLPSFYIQLDDFKVNANGKLDKTQFQKFESELYENLIEEILPKTQSEKAILKIVKNRLYAFPNNTKTNLINFGCDSIATMEIINAINITFKPEFEKNFEKNVNVENVEFDTYLNEKILHANDLYQNPTVEALADVLIKKLHNETKKSSLRLLKDGDSNLPSIIFIHPAGGGLSCFDKLIEQVKFDNICYGIEDPLLDSNQLKLLTMKQMAKNYLSIINNQIQGPFILAGYSFGGMLALEMAAQYESISENDHLLEVFLFDTWVVSCANEEIKIKLKHDVLIYCAEQRKQANVNEDSREMITLLEELCEHHQTIGFEFKPKKLISIPVCLFKATNLNNEFARMNMQDKSNFLLKFVDEKLFTIQEIKATHFDLLKSDLIAEYLTEIVNERNLKKCPNKFDKKINKGGKSMLFSPLNEINNDPEFSCLLKPKVK